MFSGLQIYEHVFTALSFEVGMPTLSFFISRAIVKCQIISIVVARVIAARGNATLQMESCDNDFYKI